MHVKLNALALTRSGWHKLCQTNLTDETLWDGCWRSVWAVGCVFAIKVFGQIVFKYSIQIHRVFEYNFFITTHISNTCVWNASVWNSAYHDSDRCLRCLVEYGCCRGRVNYYDQSYNHTRIRGLSTNFSQLFAENYTSFLHSFCFITMLTYNFHEIWDLLFYHRMIWNNFFLLK